MWAPVVAVVAVLLAMTTADATAASNMTCTQTLMAYRNHRWDHRDVPPHPIPGGNLKYCAGSVSCCTEAMEKKAAEMSEKQYAGVVVQASASLLNNFTTRARKFDEFFRELLENSKRDFHDMFKKTYGTIYEQNSEVFTDLFQDLEDYYSKGKLDLEEAMNHFFMSLYQRMFTVMNAQYPFDDKYLLPPIF